MPKVLEVYPCLNLQLTFRRITSALGERDDRYFRLAAKAKRQGDCTDAPIDIELHPIAQPEQPVHVLDTHIWKEQWRQQGEKDLSSVGMAGELQAHASLLDDGEAMRHMVEKHACRAGVQAQALKKCAQVGWVT